MKVLFSIFCLIITHSVFSQQRMNPIIADYGGVFDIPYAEEKPDPTLQYQIVIDVATGSENPRQVNDALNNVARLLNLHVVGGVPKENLHVVLAIHSGAAFTILNDQAYKLKYGVENPNLRLLKAFHESGAVRLFVCGQSLIARDIDPSKVTPDVKIATSMLTTVTTYQMKGYAMLKF